ncbi:MAG: CDP-diacylglycerol--serine O-phosphatidyltransferase [Candidatus Omnitrophica bacterium]|nr:CDP-diacylglycerol--serine O-phosphatidyltransferase [Candidatus Omnitrophota bacterium]
MNYLANFLTILSLFCGFVSIIFSMESHFTFACWAIIFSVIFDGLDGQIARKNPIPSEFGKELDSLVDTVAFGIAPAILGYIFIYQEFHFFASVALFIYLLSSVWRLARYNITPKGEEGSASYFTGLPTTASGGILAAFILIFRKQGEVVLPVYVPTVFLILVLILAYLMVSRVRYLNLDGLKQVLGKNLKSVVFALVIVLIMAGLFRKAGTTVFTIFLIYLIFSPFMVKRLGKS